MRFHFLPQVNQPQRLLERGEADLLVAGADRVATLHRRLAACGQRFLPVKLLEAPVVLPKMEQAMQWHQYRTNDPGLVRLGGLLAPAVHTMDQQAKASLP